LHLLAPSPHRFRAAILQSGTTDTWPYYSAGANQPSFLSVLNATGCADLACLRAIPLAELIAATNTTAYRWGPVVDGVFLAELPSRLIAQGKMARMSLLLGRTSWTSK
jgi:acetylcholinesterase